MAGSGESAIQFGVFIVGEAFVIATDREKDRQAKSGVVAMIDIAAGAAATMRRSARPHKTVGNPGHRFLEAGLARAVHRDHHRRRAGAAERGKQPFDMPFLVKCMAVATHHQVGAARPQARGEVDRRALNAGGVADEIEIRQFRGETGDNALGTVAATAIRHHDL